MVYHHAEPAYLVHARGTLRQMLLEAAGVGSPEHPERVRPGVSARFVGTHVLRYVTHP